MSLPLVFNAQDELLTTAETWAAYVSDEALVDLGQLQGRPAGCGFVAGIQLRVRGELERRRLLGMVIDLVYAGAAIPEELT